MAINHQPVPHGARWSHLGRGWITAVVVGQGLRDHHVDVLTPAARGHDYPSLCQRLGHGWHYFVEKKMLKKSNNSIRSPWVLDLRSPTRMRRQGFEQPELSHELRCPWQKQGTSSIRS